MSGLLINNSDYPGVAGDSIVASILGLGVIDHWFMFHPDYVTLNAGKVETLTDIVNPGVVSMTQATSTRRVALAEDIYGIAEPEGFGLFPAGNFDKASGTMPSYGKTGANFNPSAPFTLIGSFKRRDSDAENTVLFGTATTGPFWVGSTSGSQSMTLRWGTVSGVIPFANALEKNYVTVSYDGTKLRGRANDGDWIEFAPGGTATAGTLMWGTTNAGSTGNSFDGWPSDLLIVEGASIHGNDELVGLIDDYMADVLGIGA